MLLNKMYKVLQTQAAAQRCRKQDSKISDPHHDYNRQERTLEQGSTERQSRSSTGQQDRRKNKLKCYLQVRADSCSQLNSCFQELRDGLSENLSFVSS